MKRDAFYQPSDGWIGDIIPWQEDGTIHLFYLHETRETPKTGMPWKRVTLDSAFRLQEHGLALPSGGSDAPDFNVYTGSIVKDSDGVHHVFYTGNNPDHVGADGRSLQLVMHATSLDDMNTWQKLPDDTFGATEGFESGDWRDPFVFWDEDAGIWRMLIAARHLAGPERRRGTIAQMTSTDLSHWGAAEPFWDPHRYITHECPEVFRIGEWWYLVYSEFSESFCTRYRMARSLQGPWLVPEYDTLDGRAYYAAKSIEMDDRRLFFGWIATREGLHDDGAWQWAGTMAAIEAEQRADGTLAFRVPSEIVGAFDRPIPVKLNTGAEAQGGPLSAPDGYDARITTTPLPSSYRVRLDIDIAAGTRECGLELRTSADGDSGYYIRLEPQRGRMVFDRWPRTSTGSEQWQISGDVPFVVELERPCPIPAGRHTLDVIVDNDICVATLDGATVLSTRIYDRKEGHLGVFVGEGSLTINDLNVTTR